MTINLQLLYSFFSNEGRLINTYFYKYPNCFEDISDCKRVLLSKKEDLRLMLEKNESNHITEAYIKKCLKNAALDNGRALKRYRKRYTLVEMAELETQYNTANASPSSFELKQQIEVIFELAKLTIREKAIYLDYHHTGYTQDQIAKKHNITDKTVRSNIKSAQAKINIVIKAQTL